MIKRRQFIAGLGSAAALPVVARAGRNVFLQRAPTLAAPLKSLPPAALRPWRPQPLDGERCLIGAWCVPLDSHRSHQVNVVVPNNCQCTNSSTLSRANFRKHSEARVLWNRKRLYFRIIHAFSF